MSTVELRPFDLSHLEHWEPWHDKLFNTVMATDGDYMQRLFLASVMPDGITRCCYSGFIDGVWMGALGFIPFPGAWSCTAEVWMFIDAAWRGHVKTIHRYIKERVEWAMELHRFTRLQAYVDVSDRRANRWIEALGFQRETKDEGLRCHGPQGQAYHIYGRIR